MKITTNITIKTNIVCPACQTKFAAVIDKAREVIEGQCPKCGKTVSVPGRGVLGMLAKKTADISAAAEKAGNSDIEPIKVDYSVAVGAGVKNRMTSIAHTCNIAGGLAAIWTIFYPRPYPVAILASFVLPLFCLIVLWVSQGAIRLVDNKKERFPYLTIGCIAPMAALAFRAVFDFTPVSFRPIFNPLFIFTISMTFLIWMAAIEVREKIGKLLLVIPFVIIFGYGAVMEANCLFDLSKPEIYNAMVLAKRTSSTRGSKSYYLTVSPWGPRQQKNEISVSRRKYDSVNVNDEAAIGLKKGRLGIPWYRMLDINAANAQKTSESNAAPD